ncbi:MAG: NUDIX domain-containing protein [Mycolicibacterium sp.]|uniref:NUDIX domain-containing protein n=1 Tax=Mycolicibacterium sp. TaxID=2320850 RepID=UPI003D1051C5
MPKLSAGLLLYRHTGRLPEVLIGHPGGPFWTAKDEGAWSIPKGEYGEGEDPWTVAKREFLEEIGKPAPAGDPTPLTPVRQPGGKVIAAFALRGDLELAGTSSNTFLLEWPPGSGQLKEYPEFDRIAWLAVPAARSKLLRGQHPLLDELQELLERGDMQTSGPH